MVRTLVGVLAALVLLGTVAVTGTTGTAGGRADQVTPQPAVSTCPDPPCPPMTPPSTPDPLAEAVRLLTVSLPVVAALLALVVVLRYAR